MSDATQKLHDDWVKTRDTRRDLEFELTLALRAMLENEHGGADLARKALEKWDALWKESNRLADEMTKKHAERAAANSSSKGA